MIKRYKFLFVFIILVGCNIFNSPTKTKNDDLFELSILYNNERITDALTIPLSWSEITIDNFKEIKITRLNEHRDPDSYLVGTTDNGWITIAVIENEFTTSWVDTVKDDASFKYRVEYYNQDGDYRRAAATVVIQPTSRIVVPTDVDSIKTAVESYIIDNGDTVLVLPGLYMSYSFSFGDKEVYLINPNQNELVGLIWVPRMAEVEPLADTSFITIRAGLIRGFGIVGSSVMNGGAINAKGNAIIRNCFIRNNIASDRPVGLAVILNAGYGGGLYLSDQVTVENCIIDSNSATKKGSGIYIDEFANNVKIVNCVLNVNDLHSESSNVSIENTIITGILPEISDASVGFPAITYSHIGFLGTGLSTTNITGEILFRRILYNADYQLLPGSVCIDAGNPDPIFNDPDDSRNDIGAFGGPSGGWTFQSIGTD